MSAVIEIPNTVERLFAEIPETGWLTVTIYHGHLRLGSQTAPLAYLPPHGTVTVHEFWIPAERPGRVTGADGRCSYVPNQIIPVSINTGMGKQTEAGVAVEFELEVTWLLKEIPA